MLEKVTAGAGSFPTLFYRSDNNSQQLWLAEDEPTAAAEPAVEIQAGVGKTASQRGPSQ